MVQEVDSASLDRIPMLIRGLRHAGICVMYQDRALAMRLVENPFDSWPQTATILERGDRVIFDTETAEYVIAAKRRVLSTGESERLEVRVRHASGDCWYALNIEPDASVTGVVRGLFVTASDITEVKRREETLKGLLSEVSHRSRNLLAIIQSILAHTARTENAPDEFAIKFRGRIQSLALTQDIVTQANWRGASFRHLVAVQVAQLAGGTGVEVAVDGFDAQLAPGPALHLGLALHELATNAATFGVLKRDAGRIEIAFEDSGDHLHFIWQERHAEPVDTPTRPRFGSAVLCRVLPQAVLGSARLDIDPTGVRYDLELPRSALG